MQRISGPGLEQRKLRVIQNLVELAQAAVVSSAHELPDDSPEWPVAYVDQGARKKQSDGADDADGQSSPRGMQRADSQRAAFQDDHQCENRQKTYENRQQQPGNFHHCFIPMDNSHGREQLPPRSVPFILYPRRIASEIGKKFGLHFVTLLLVKSASFVACMF